MNAAKGRLLEKTSTTSSSKRKKSKHSLAVRTTVCIPKRESLTPCSALKVPVTNNLFAKMEQVIKDFYETVVPGYMFNLLKGNIG